MRRGDEFGALEIVHPVFIDVKWDNGSTDTCYGYRDGMPNCDGYMLKIAEGMYLRLCVKL